jgi:hypothetical protein
MERPRNRWESNIKMGLKEMEWEGVEWINLGLGALVEMMINVFVP